MREPGDGELRIGERVLVDDGSCPNGQIKEVVGVSNPKARTDPKVTTILRLRHCVKR